VAVSGWESPNEPTSGEVVDVRAVPWSPNRAAGQGRSGPARRRLCGDEGAALIEAAFVTPVFFLLIFGVLEFGGAFRTYLTLSNVTTTASRTAAVAGNDVDADAQVLTSIKKESAAIQVSSIQRVVVYHAAGPTSAVPAGCAGGTATAGTGSPSYTGACNVYTSADITTPANASTCAVTSPARFWCPSVRKVAASGTNGPPDYVGIYVSVKHSYLTGLFGKSLSLTSTTVAKLEPSTLN
jgi:Flp pilus assembly protein TadG